MNKDNCGDEIKIDEDQVEYVIHFEYLGAGFQSWGKIILKIQMITMATETLTTTVMERTRFKHEDETDTRNPRISSCSLRLRDLDTKGKKKSEKLQTFEMKCYREIFRM